MSWLGGREERGEGGRREGEGGGVGRCERTRARTLLHSRRISTTERARLCADPRRRRRDCDARARDASACPAPVRRERSDIRRYPLISSGDFGGNSEELGIRLRNSALLLYLKGAAVAALCELWLRGWRETSFVSPFRSRTPLMPGQKPPAI